MLELKQLVESFENNKLAHAWLINGDNEQKCYELIENFAEKIFSKHSEVSLINNPDFRFYPQEEKSAAKKSNNISIEDIRDIFEFFNQSSALNIVKIAVIRNADLMTVNAANSILKILEEPPKNCLLFLTSTRPNALLLTIRSRVRALKIKADFVIEPETYQYIVENFMTTDIRKFEKFISGFNKSTKNEYYDLVKYLQLFFAKALKLNYQQVKINFNEEQKLLDSFININNLKLLSFYEEIVELLNKSYLQDLDRKQTGYVVRNKLQRILSNA